MSASAATGGSLNSGIAWRQKECGELPTVDHKKSKHVLAGYAAGMCGVVVGHPFDTLRIRLQASNYAGLVDCLRKTIHAEGVEGLAKGITTPLFGVGILKAVSFGAYGTFSQFLKKKGEEGPLSLDRVLLAGIGAGIVNSAIICPMDRVKILLQLQGQPMQIVEERGSFGWSLKSWRQHHFFEGPVDVISKVGLAGLYKGAFATVLREMVGLGAYFFTYESLKRLFTKEGDMRPSVPKMLLAGGLTGMTTWTLNFPFDAVKSRIQAQNTSPLVEDKKFLAVMRDIHRTGGPRLFFKGWSTAMLRAFPVHATILMMYEFSMKLMERM